MPRVRASVARSAVLQSHHGGRRVGAAAAAPRDARSPRLGQPAREGAAHVRSHRSPDTDGCRGTHAPLGAPGSHCRRDLGAARRDGSGRRARDRSRRDPDTRRRGRGRPSNGHRAAASTRRRRPRRGPRARSSRVGVSARDRPASCPAAGGVSRTRTQRRPHRRRPLHRAPRPRLPPVPGRGRVRRASARLDGAVPAGRRPVAGHRERRVDPGPSAGPHMRNPERDVVAPVRVALLSRGWRPDA